MPRFLRRAELIKSSPSPFDRGQDAIKRGRQHCVADHRPAASYLRKSGNSAARGVSALDSDKVGGSGHGASSEAARRSNGTFSALAIRVIASKLPGFFPDSISDK